MLYSPHLECKENSILLFFFLLPLFLAAFVLSPAEPCTAMDSPAALRIPHAAKEGDVGDKKCHFTKLSPRKCDKYCHATTAGRGVTTRYGMEWRGACTSGMARAKPISDGHFPWWVPKTERVMSEISPSVASMIEGYRRERP